LKGAGVDAENVDITINESEEGSAKQKKSPSKGPGLKMIIILGGILVLLGAGGYFGYTLLFQEKTKGTKAAHKENKGKEKMVLVALDPFILNLADPGRHLKATIQFELNDEKDEIKVKEQTPKLRDVIIMLLSSKTLDAVSSPEGKFQLKDDILLRANQAMEKEMFKNVYFTDFVMQ
jgi:flagellar protein FliL